MRSLAEVLLGWGWQVSGSDLAADAMADLGALGVRLHRGHAAEHVPAEADLVVASDAVPAHNPERRRAAELRLPTWSYFEALGRLMHGRRGIAVAGTHGKSTTAAMLAELLVRAGRDPVVAFGAAPLGRISGGRAGRGDEMVVEACEYRANFLHLRAQQAVILAIEPDHFDCFDTVGQLEWAFRRFAASVPSEGLLLIRDDCPASARAAAGAGCRVETFGFGRRSDWSARGVIGRRGRYGFAIHRRQRHVADVALGVAGRHNVLNALAAAALASENGLAAEQIGAGLSDFRGLRRRLEHVGTRGGVTVLDDYAHHPTEVAAGLDAVRQMYPGRRLWCVFQPHQVSRTRRLLDELAHSLQNADTVAVAEIYRAREPVPRPGEVSAAELAARVRRRGIDVADVHAPDEILALLASRVSPGDVLITMGAGDIGKVCYGFMDRLREDRAAG